MSLWGAIQKGALRPTRELSRQDFRDFLMDLEVKSEKPEREFVMVTGTSGMKMINDAMQTQVYLNLMKNLNFSREERKRLGEMIKSPDPENFQIAKILIDNKLAEAKEYHGNSKK